MKLRRFLAVLLALVLALGTTALAAGPFSDVAEDAYYADAVEWAAEKKITTGYEDDTFRPDRTVNRAEAVTFLWRMAGEPEPTQRTTFDDVENDPKSGWYKTAVQWAVENGITNGTGKGFEPYETCKRGMILTMLYRLQGCPYDEALKAILPEDEESWTLEDVGNWMVQLVVGSYREAKLLTDVREGDWYELPIIWALNANVLGENQAEFHTEGLREDETPTVTVDPKADCPRGEMVSFLYQASGEAPLEGAVKVGKIPETVLLDEGGVKVTAAKIRSEGLTDAVVELTVVNGSDKTLRLDADETYVNTYACYPQVCIPTETEDGFTSYPDAVVAPGETADCEMRLNSLGDTGITSVCELELRLKAVEVEKDEDGYYIDLDDYAAGEAISIRTSLYDPSVSYDTEGGTLLLDEDGIQIYLLGTEIDEFWGPKLKLYSYNGGSEDYALDIQELKLDGVAFDCIFSMNLAAGKRDVSEANAFFMGDEVPTARTVEVTFQTVDPVTWAPVKIFAPVTVTIPD